MTAQRQGGGRQPPTLAVGYHILSAGSNHRVAGLVLLVQSPCFCEQRERRVDRDLHAPGPGTWPEVFLRSPWLQNVLYPSKEFQVDLE